VAGFSDGFLIFEDCSGDSDNFIRVVSLWPLLPFISTLRYMKYLYTEIDGCDGSPCSHYATCTDITGAADGAPLGIGFTCTCLPEFETTDDGLTCTACPTCGSGTYHSGTSNECEACKTSCSTGQYMGGIDCDGSSYYDTVTCENCKTSCSPGQYMSGSCDGSDFSDIIVCEECDTAANLVSNCEYWSNAGFCTGIHAVYMSANCALSCSCQ